MQRTMEPCPLAQKRGESREVDVEDEKIVVYVWSESADLTAATGLVVREEDVAGEAVNPRATHSHQERDGPRLHPGRDDRDLLARADTPIAVLGIWDHDIMGKQGP